MKLQDVINKEKPTEERRTIILSIRTTPSVSKWMADNNVRPSKVFNLAIEELMQEKKK